MVVAIGKRKTRSTIPKFEGLKTCFPSSKGEGMRYFDAMARNDASAKYTGDEARKKMAIPNPAAIALFGTKKLFFFSHRLANANSDIIAARTATTTSIQPR